MRFLLIIVSSYGCFLSAIDRVFGGWTQSKKVNALKAINIVVFGIPFFVYRLAHILVLTAIMLVKEAIRTIFDFTVILKPLGQLIGLLFDLVYNVVHHLMSLVLFPICGLSHVIYGAILRKNGIYDEYYA